MLRDVNDTPALAAQLLHLLRDMECKVNLIVFNVFDGADFSPSTPAAVQAFRCAPICISRCVAPHELWQPCNTVYSLAARSTGTLTVFATAQAPVLRLAGPAALVLVVCQ